jgi:hypothetical protein
MIVTVRRRARSPNLRVHWGAQDARDAASENKVTLEKAKLTSCIQMLHENESSVLASTEKAAVKIKNIGNNQFVITFSHLVDGVPCTQCEGHVAVQGTSWQPYDTLSTPHASMLGLLAFARRQVLPRYSKACVVAKNMQTLFGSVVPQCTDAHDCRVDDAFLHNNATTVSKLTDMLTTAECGRQFSPVAAARLAWLAAVFCSTAPPSKAFSMFNVTQMQMTDMSDYTVEHLYERAPEKHHLTVLMRGENADDRIRRFNVAVRMFSADSEFVKDLLPKIIGLNATIYSPVMVVSGVRNNQAAAIFLSSETLTTNSHKSAMRTFLCGLSPTHAESGL